MNFLKSEFSNLILALKEGRKKRLQTCNFSSQITPIKTIMPSFYIFMKRYLLFIAPPETINNEIWMN